MWEARRRSRIHSKSCATRRGKNWSSHSWVGITDALWALRRSLRVIVTAAALGISPIAPTSYLSHIVSAVRTRRSRRTAASITSTSLRSISSGVDPLDLLIKSAGHGCRSGSCTDDGRRKLRRDYPTQGRLFSCADQRIATALSESDRKHGWHGHGAAH